ncbi:reverse transcriptase family protein [Streptococcus orisratti]|uniref:reverse transcriptase family protein n=1 Tax=Streptococcus orisratti TaxID=114652 RepID=UPI0023F8C56C|nr:reverse transcriptase family protein [Streptococcus orisratti]
MNPILVSEQQIKLLFKIAMTEDVIDFVKDNNLVYSKCKYNGETRFISSPSEHLKIIQRWIVDNILVQKSISDVAHAYVREKSIFTNARVHVGNKALLKMDISNFFDSIPITKVKEIFLSLGYNLAVSQVLADLCTNNGYVRQGFVTSPLISNIILKDFDDKLINTLKKSCYSKYEFKYTRYADDITISSKYKVKSKLKEIEQEVMDILEVSGFSANLGKTRLIIGESPKKITGIIVKESSISVPNRFKKELLKELYYCRKFGVTSHLIYTGNYGKLNYIEHLKGLAMFIKNTDQKFYESVISQISELDLNS